MCADTHGDRNLSDIGPKTNPILGWTRDNNHPHLGVIDERGWVTYSNQGQITARRPGHGPELALEECLEVACTRTRTKGVTSLVLFSLKEGCALLLRYQITIAKAWSGLHTYMSSARRSSVGSPTMLSVGMELRDHKPDRWDRIGYGMMVGGGGGGARRSLLCQEGKEK